MPKGQRAIFPSYCITNTLPHIADISGLVTVKLKRKLSFPGDAPSTVLFKGK